MVAGVPDRLWSVDDLVTLWESHENRTGKERPKKREKSITKRDGLAFEGAARPYFEKAFGVKLTKERLLLSIRSKQVEKEVDLVSEDKHTEVCALRHPARTLQGYRVVAFGVASLASERAVAPWTPTSEGASAPR